jgi:lipopolysaccharide/colanic/teichoic acid biosynthesis glycosyltransferase
MKRIFDVVCSGLALVALSPILVPIMILLRCTGEGEIFYRQQRIGRGGKPFGILKFATMLKNSPNMVGGDVTVGADPRVLPIGRVLRKTKVNELPQLLNILLGDMSVIGPRPLTQRVADLFPPEHWEALAHLRPGLSGIGSIVFRDEERLLDAAADRMEVYARVIAPYKAALELWYAQRQSLLLDLKLIALTLLAVVRPDLDLQRYLSGLPTPPAELERLRGSRPLAWAA